MKLMFRSNECLCSGQQEVQRVQLYMENTEQDQRWMTIQEEGEAESAKMETDLQIG